MLNSASGWWQAARFRAVRFPPTIIDCKFHANMHPTTGMSSDRSTSRITVTVFKGTHGSKRALSTAEYHEADRRCKRVNVWQAINTRSKPGRNYIRDLIVHWLSRYKTE